VKGEEVQQRLASQNEMDFRSAEALALDIVRDARIPLGTLQRMLTRPESPDRKKAELILKMLDELSFFPWLVAAGQMDGASQVHAFFEAFRVYQSLERQILQNLRAMLKKRDPLPLPDTLNPAERSDPVVRECDEAYLLLRHLDNPDEPTAEYRQYGYVFARLSERERDRLIESYVDKGTFD
jgi:hypothetical protein